MSGKGVTVRAPTEEEMEKLSLTTFRVPFSPKALEYPYVYVTGAIVLVADPTPKLSWP